MQLIKILILFCISLAATANTTGYEVELVIFEDTSARYITSEDWSYNDMLQQLEEDKQQNTAKSDTEFKFLDSEQGKLKNNIKKLLNNPNYRVLLNKRWKQTGLDRKQAFSIPVNTNETSTANENNLAEQTVKSYIQGDVKLIMSRYLHFNVNLQYMKPQLDADAQLTYLNFPVVSERRMRSREVHYIDHPLVGVIVLATPYEIETEEEQTKPANYKTL